MGDLANERQVGGSHYRKQGVQHWDYILANDIPYMEAQIIKYVSRWRDKGGIQDLEKAAHFLQKLTEHEKAKVKEEAEGGWNYTAAVDEFCSKGFHKWQSTEDNNLWKCADCGITCPVGEVKVGKESVS